MKRSKAYLAAAKKIEVDNLYSPIEAARLVKETTTTKFDSSVEVSMRLGVDPRKADQLVRGTVNLPHGTGKTARVLVFANGEKAEDIAEALNISRGSVYVYKERVQKALRKEVRRLDSELG